MIISVLLYPKVFQRWIQNSLMQCKSQSHVTARMPLLICIRCIDLKSLPWFPLKPVGVALGCYLHIFILVGVTLF